MKNYALTLLIVLFLGAFGGWESNAQSSTSTSTYSSSSYQKVRLGLFFNPTLTWLKPTGANIDKQKSRFGFNYGLLLDINITDNYIIHTGLTIGQLYGGTLRYTQGGVDSSYTYKLDYIEIPLTFKLMTNDIGQMRYWGQFGVVNSFRFKDQVILKDNTTGEVDETRDQPYGTGFYNLALQVGGGVEFNVSGRTYLVFGIIYRNGFIDQIKDNYRYPGKTFLNSLVFMTGVMF